MNEFYTIRSEVNQRPNNEDSFLALELNPPNSPTPVWLLAVADGMGGHARGEDVSREALRRLGVSLFEQLCMTPALNQEKMDSLRMETLGRALQEALEQANDFVRRMASANRWGKAGTTVVAVLLWGHRAIATNVGDSPLFHYRRGDRTVKQLTLDHTVAAALVRGGMITAEMGKYHEGRNQLEFYLGRETLPGDPLIEITLEPGDRLLLCTDGISSPIDNLQLLSCLTIASRSESAQALIDTAQNAGSTDNQTLIIWQYGDSAISQATVQQIN